MKKKLSLIVILITGLSACVKEIDLNLPEYSSKLVVNGELDTENDISLQVSRSMPVMQANDSSGYLIQNAVVRIFENGADIGSATYFSGRFVLNKKPKAGATYRIDVSSGKYPDAQANLVVPSVIPVNVTYKDSIGLDADGFKLGQINLTFRDEPDRENYFKLLIRYYSSGIQQWFPFEPTSNDIIFLNNEKLNDGSYLFSDRTFSGRTKSLTFNVPFGLAMGTPKFAIVLKSFDADYYEYLRATDDYNQTGDGLSSEPVILKTNVSNGLGMVGGVSNARDTIY